MFIAMYYVAIVYERQNLKHTYGTLYIHVEVYFNCNWIKYLYIRHPTRIYWSTISKPSIYLTRIYKKMAHQHKTTIMLSEYYMKEDCINRKCGYINTYTLKCTQWYSFGTYIYNRILTPTRDTTTILRDTRWLVFLVLDIVVSII